MDGIEDAQPSIEAEKDANKSAKVDVEDELLADQIRATRKVNCIATIEALHFKLSSLSCMLVFLCRMVAMPIVRPTLSSNLALLEYDFVHGFKEGAAVLYLSITNEGGQITRRKESPIQLVKERLSVLYDSYTTKQLRN
jgi:hypothetical protein